MPHGINYTKGAELLARFGEVLKMVEDYNNDDANTIAMCPSICVKYRDTVQDRMTAAAIAQMYDGKGYENYTFARAIVGRRPVFDGDVVFTAAGDKLIMSERTDCSIQSQQCSWTLPMVTIGGREFTAPKGIARQFLHRCSPASLIVGDHIVSFATKEQCANIEQAIIKMLTVS